MSKKVKTISDLPTKLSELGKVGSDEDPNKLLSSLGGTKELVTRLNTDSKVGLTTEQVTINRDLYGSNVLPEKKPKPFWDHLVEALSDDTLRILLFSAVCSMFFGFSFSDNKADIIQGIAILIAVVVVSGVNSIQNYSKDKEFHSLAQYSSKRNVRVIRNGERTEVSSADLVVGDIIVLHTGERIPSDGILLTGDQVEVNMSSLNGEQVPSERHPDHDSILHHSVLICNGSDIRMMVTAVGTNTEFGRLAKDVTEAEDKETPLQEKLSELAEQIGNIGTIVGFLTFSVLTALWIYNSKVDIITLLKTDFPALIRFFIVGVTIVVVAVPEGLPLAVTVSLAFSMQRMLADKNLVRELQACETMGSATVVASDKTGTLTQNRMTVTKVFFPIMDGKRNHEAIDISKTSLVSAVGTPTLTRLANAIACNSEAELRVDDEDNTVSFDGSPTEGALLHMLANAKIDYSVVRSSTEKLARRAFTKENKFQTTIAAAEGGVMVYVTGAPEVVVSMCTSIHGTDGKNHAIVDEMVEELLAHQRHLARQGLRVIAIAFKRADKASAASQNWASKLGNGPNKTIEGDLALWGFFGIQDPPRPGVPEAVNRIQNAGVRVIMVTGDSPDTAEEIARQCGILPPINNNIPRGTVKKSSKELIMTGSEFRALSDERKQEVAKNLSVMARCSPNDKLQLVAALQANKEIVAVTGDGTNDAPALKAADVGLSMGIAGTEVAKEASKIVITDDNFASIVATVRWGRSIKENIRKFLTFQLTINIVALFLTFVTACLNNGNTEKFPIKPVQLLWINLIMDSFAALMLATEPPSERLMQYKPQGKDEDLITRTMLKNMLGHAIFQSLLLLWLTMTESGSAFFGLDYIRADDAMDITLQRKEDTIVFNVFVWLQIFNLFNCRAVHDEWNILEGFTNSVITQVILVIIIISQFFIVQLGGEILQTEPLTIDEWKSCIYLGLLSLPVGYFLKLVPVCDRELRSVTETDELAMEINEAANIGATRDMESSSTSNKGRDKKATKSDTTPPSSSKSNSKKGTKKTN